MDIGPLKEVTEIVLGGFYVPSNLILTQDISNLALGFAEKIKIRRWSLPLGITFSFLELEKFTCLDYFCFW